MNMKIEENEVNQGLNLDKNERHGDEFYGMTIDEDVAALNDHINPEKEKPIHYMNFEESAKKRKQAKNFPNKRDQNLNKDERQEGVLKVIPKIDDKTPTSSILDLQKKLDQISSPASNVSASTVSIPVAHKEYEKALRTLE